MLWTQSCFVETIGNANEDAIRAYVQNQLSEMNRKEGKSLHNQVDRGLRWLSLLSSVTKFSVA